MSAQVHQHFESLAAGQLWKIENGYILITEEGKRVVSYKKLRDPNQRAGATNLFRPEALVAYLNEIAAELVKVAA